MRETDRTHARHNITTYKKASFFNETMDEEGGTLST